MGFFSQGEDINTGVEDFLNTPGAVLIDVREASEYAEGHIEGALNIPLRQLNLIMQYAPTADVPLYVYCTAGVRSQQAVDALIGAGYQNVRNIGGIASWRGDVVKE